MPELNKSTDEQLINIKNNILKDVDHNKPKMPRFESGSFLDALSLGSQKFSNSKLKNMVADSQEV